MCHAPNLMQGGQKSRQGRRVCRRISLRAQVGEAVGLCAANQFHFAAENVSLPQRFPQRCPMSWLERLAERRMLFARAKGQFSGIEGEGKPLADRTGDAFVSAGEAVAFRIMAEAGVLPEEITLKKAADAQRDVLASLTDPSERKAAMAKLADLEMRREMAIESRRKFMT